MRQLCWQQGSLRVFGRSNNRRYRVWGLQTLRVGRVQSPALALGIMVCLISLMLTTSQSRQRWQTCTVSMTSVTGSFSMCDPWIKLPFYHLMITLTCNFLWLIPGTELDSLKVGPRTLQFSESTRWFAHTKAWKQPTEIKKQPQWPQGTSADGDWGWLTLPWFNLKLSFCK